MKKHQIVYFSRVTIIVCYMTIAAVRNKHTKVMGL